MKKLLLFLFFALGVYSATTAEAQAPTCVTTPNSFSCSWASIPAVIDAGAPIVADAGKPVVDAGKPIVVDAGMPPVVNPPQGTVSRPSASKGVGLFVVGSKVYDGNGAEFRMRGTNKTHQDSWAPSLGLMKSNATRWVVYFTEDPNRTLKDFNSASIGGTFANGKAVAIPGFWDGTCKSDAATFETMVARWVRDAKTFQTQEKNIVLNIANEWGSDENAWRDAYIAAIPRIREAGWNGMIMVDAPMCGQNALALARQGAAILAADPQKNVVFSVHIYGYFYDSVGGVPLAWNGQMDLLPTMNALRDAKIAVVVGEFGPGKNIGPSPTNVKPERIVALAEERGFGWLTWSYDDWDGANESSSENWFGHIKQGGTYQSDADLTAWGRTAKSLWLKYEAKPASTF